MFSNESIKFLDDLKKNNATEWMHENKKRYEAYKKDYHTLIASVLDKMKSFDESLEPLEVKNCTFRINRDIRFSKDKSPYKTNMGIWMTNNKSRKNGAGYYIHFEKGNCFIGGGIWCPETDDLKKIRAEINFFHDDLNTVLEEKTFKTAFGSLNKEDGMVLKTAPKGFDPNHPAIELLKLKSFTISQKIDDKLFSDKDFAFKISEKLALMKPFNDFLNRALTTEN